MPSRIEPTEAEDVQTILEQIRFLQGRIDSIVTNMEEQAASYDLILMEHMLSAFYSNLEWWAGQLQHRLDGEVDDLVEGEDV